MKAVRKWFQGKGTPVGSVGIDCLGGHPMNPKTRCVKEDGWKKGKHIYPRKYLSKEIKRRVGF
jgi:hypothetical protein